MKHQLILAGALAYLLGQLSIVAVQTVSTAQRQAQAHECAITGYGDSRAVAQCYRDRGLPAPRSLGR